MDYSKIYKSIIRKRLENPHTEETHHIIPKCVGGTDSPCNLVKLSKREHKFVHLLLPKIYPDSVGLRMAANLFSEKRLKYPVWNKGMEMPDEQKVKISKKKSGRSLTETHKSAISKSCPTKKKVILSKGTETIEFQSAVEASRFLGVPHQNVFRVLRKIRKSLKGYNISYG